MGRRWGNRRWSWGYNHWQDDDYGGWKKKSKKTQNAASSSRKTNSANTGGGRRNWAFSTSHVPDLSFALQQFSDNVAATSGPNMVASEVEIVIDNDMGDDELDHESLLCSMRGDIVGIRYYSGTVNNKEMVSLVREPQNKYDRNAVKVTNILGEQVGHIKKELARALTQIMDPGLARLEGVVPFGTKNVYTMPVDLSFWGRPENKAITLKRLRDHGYYPAEAGPTGIPTQVKSSAAMQSQGKEGSFGSQSYQPNRTTVIDAAKNLKSELNNMFDSLKMFDKTSTREPTEAISTTLFPHQKIALSWMSQRENVDKLPPFWIQLPSGTYRNTVTNHVSNSRPAGVTGGMLADDMGLGKTLQIIALILTNFKEGEPLARIVPGKIRQSTIAKKIRLEAYRSSFANDCYDGPKAINARKSLTLKGDASNFIDEAPVVEPSGTKRKRSLNLKGSASLVTSGDKEAEFTDEDEMTDTESEDETPESSQQSLNTVTTMMQKDDPDFSPGIKMKKTKSAPAKVVAVSSPIASRRPRREAKKPARYTYSSEEDNVDEEVCETPKKKVKKDTVKAKATQGQKIKGKGKGRGKNLEARIKEVASNKENREDCAIVLDTDELPELSCTDVQIVSTSSQYKPATSGPPLPSLTDSTISSINIPECSQDDDTLPDTQVQILEECGAHITDTGRTPCTGPRATLIVCPLSVLSNWLDQFEEHLHKNVHLEIYLYYGNDRRQSHIYLGNQDVVITTYSTIAAEARGGPKKNTLGKVEWLRVVLDEGHTIRNPNAQQTKAIMDLKAKRKWILTGTPIQNSLKDLFSLIKFLGVTPLDTKEYWNRAIERPIMKQKSSEAMDLVRMLMSAIALRRMKTTLVDGKPMVDLPSKTIQIEHVKLSDDERKTYEAMQNEGRLIVTRYCQRGDLITHYGEVLTILLRLRQICCHPFLVAKVSKAVEEIIESAPADATPAELKKTLIEKIMTVLNSGSDEECPICLDPLKKPVITHCAHLFCRGCIEEVIQNEQAESRCPLCRGDIAQEKLVEVPPETEKSQSAEEERVVDQLDGVWQTSAKTDAVMNAVINLRVQDPSIKSVIVSQFTAYLTVLERPLRENGFKFVRLDGSMRNNQRVSAIEAFSDENPGAPTIMLLSLKAGGVGINLTAASRLFLMEPAWNPASEDQCFDRIHRLGQTRDVIVTKFIVEDSVEERMLELQEKKRELASGALDGAQGDNKKGTADQRRTNRINDLKNLMDL